MTKRKSLELKGKRLFHQAVIATEHGQSIRAAAAIARLPHSTFHYRLKQLHVPRKPRTYLTEAEETVIVGLLERYALQGFPLRRTDLSEAIKIFVDALSVERQKALPFRNNIPGKKFLKNFADRHRERINFVRASKQEEIRWAATNATNITQHFAALESVISENNIDPCRIANLDETGTTPNRDCRQTARTKVYNLRGTPPQQRSPEFENVNRITLMSVIFANGVPGRSMFVCKGKHLKYRTSFVQGKPVLETLADCLPRGSIVTMRENVAGVDNPNFIEWAKLFVKDAADLTIDNRKVLLILDGYRSHMTYQALKILQTGGVIVYALPAHTSGYTQPLDVSVFGPFKESLRANVERLASPCVSNKYDIFDYLKIMREAFFVAFTRRNILSGFAKAGIWPLHPPSLLSRPLPESSRNRGGIMTVEELANMLEMKRSDRRNGLGLRPTMTSNGYLDTSAGLVLTTTSAMALVYGKFKRDRAKMKAQQLRERNREEAQKILYEKTRETRIADCMRRAQWRTATYGEPFLLPRPLRIRRQIAKDHTALRRFQKNEAAHALLSIAVPRSGGTI